MIKKVTKKVKALLKKKPNYQQLYLDQRKLTEHWEFKYNKLYRQLNAIIKENNVS